MWLLGLQVGTKWHRAPANGTNGTLPHGHVALQPACPSVESKPGQGSPRSLRPQRSSTLGCRVRAEPCTHGQEQSCGCCAHVLGARLRARCLHTHARALSWLAHSSAHSLGVFKCIFAPLHACALLMCSLPACPFGSCTVHSVPRGLRTVVGRRAVQHPKKGSRASR